MIEEGIFFEMENDRLKVVPAKAAFECPAYGRYFRFAGVCDRDAYGPMTTRFQAYGPTEGFDMVVFFR